MQHVKPKSAYKQIIPSGDTLDGIVSSTLSTIAKIVGTTLGPGGRPVLIERQENLPPLITKDGVTVFRNLGFADSVSQNILESTIDASVRTANEAGDGTTTATIFAEAFYSNTRRFCKANSTIPSIAVIKKVQDILNKEIFDIIEENKIECKFGTKKGRKLLHGVASVSANGDKELADSVLRCFDICGDEGNVTITEKMGATGYSEEKIEGYPIPVGYEKSCEKFYPAFINDKGTQKVVYERPLFILYYGQVADIQVCLPILEKIQQAKNYGYLSQFNVVIFATGFSDNVLANFARITSDGNNINVFPVVVTPDSAVNNYHRNFLDDISAVVGSEVFDPLTKPLDQMELVDLGNCAVDDEDSITPKYVPLGVKGFEAGRYRSTVIGFCNEDILIERIEKVKKGLLVAESEYELIHMQERLGKLSGGIARLNVIGNSNGEVKERRDRAEDAICAVRGAIKHGALIGGGWTIYTICQNLLNSQKNDELRTKVVEGIVVPSLFSVIQVLYINAGACVGRFRLDQYAMLNSADSVMNLSTGGRENPLSSGLLDSLPALKEALRNSISIATLAGTLGGCVVHPRDKEADLLDARDANEFNRVASMDRDQ